MIRNIGRSTATVFITGESGTGKEIAAHAIHQQSIRRDGPFVPSTAPPSRGPSGIRGLRPSQGLVHGRHRRQARGGGGGGRRHAVPGRDLRDGSCAADEAAPLPADLDDPARWRRRAAQGRCPHRLRDEPRPRRRGSGRPLPRGSVLPSPRRADRHAAAARARRGRHRDRRAAACPLCARGGQGLPRLQPPRPRCALRLFVAGQCPPARERASQRDRAARGRRDHARHGAPDDPRRPAALWAGCCGRG